MKRPGEILPTPGDRSLGQLLYETLHGQVEGMKPLCGEPYANILPESIARYEHAASVVVTAALARREAEIVGILWTLGMNAAAMADCCDENGASYASEVIAEAIKKIQNGGGA